MVLGLSGKMRVCACVSVCVLDGERERVRERMRGCKCDSSSTVFFLLVLPPSLRCSSPSSGMRDKASAESESRFVMSRSAFESFNPLV